MPPGRAAAGRWAGNHGAVRWLSRATRASLCLALVLLAHGALWVAASRSSEPIGPRVTPVRVRQLVAPDAAVGREPVPAATGAQAAGPLRAPAPRRPRPALGARDEATKPMATRSPAMAAEPAMTDAPASGQVPLPNAASVELYPTRIPPSTQLNFTLQRGSAAGAATLSWQIDGGRYVLQLQASMPTGRQIEQRSQGGFDEAGLAPLRLADRRRGRDLRAANFQREHGKISFSGPRWEWPLQGGTQDRLSWLVQLVAIASAGPDVLREGAELSMWVVGVRGAVAVWRFEVRERQQLSAAGSQAQAWWLVREPAHPYDLRVEVWLDPARGHWPIRLRQTQVPGGEPVEWTLREEPQAAPGT